MSAPQNMGVHPGHSGPGCSETLEITSLAVGGRGVGRSGGQVWFVPRALPGDKVEARVLRRHSRWVDAEIVRILEPSRSRRDVPCPFQSSCGGCPWMPLPETIQGDWKRGLLGDVLRRIGKLDAGVVEEARRSPTALRYRNKVELTFGLSRAGAPVLGFHGSGEQGRIVDIPACLLQAEEADSVLVTAREFFLEGAGRGDPALQDTEEPLRLVIRSSSVDGSLLVALRGRDRPFSSARAFASVVRARHPRIVGVVRLLAQPGRRGGVRTEILEGADRLVERLGGTLFDVPAASFFQVNPSAAEGWVSAVLEVSGGPGSGKEVLELYGGVGVLGLALARSGARVTIVEADPMAVDSGRGAATRAGIVGVSFVNADAAGYLRRAATRIGTPELVVADPPRSGLPREVAERLLGMAPERIVLVSCDPPALARDAGILVRGGYRLERVIPIDLFPQTAHLEAVAALARKSEGTDPSR